MVWKKPTEDCVSTKMLRDRSFHKLLWRIDHEVALEHRHRGCRECGGRLDSARYPRKPRGSPVVEGEDCSRLSYCCARRDCRRRLTPPSVRFLGRKVFLGAVVVLVSALRQGVTPARYARLREWFGVSADTVRRWRRWWLEVFAGGVFWRAACGRLVPQVSAALLPLSLLERFGRDREGLALMLRFISPVTAATAGTTAELTT